MTPFTRHGVPRSIAHDGWWLATAADSQRGSAAPAVPKATWPLAGVIALVAAADWALWQGFGALPLAGFTLIFAAVLCLVFRPSYRRALGVFVLAILSLAPAVAFYQALSVAVWCAGLWVMLLWVLDVPIDRGWAMVWRVPFAGFKAFFGNIPATQVGTSSKLARAIRDWALAAGVGFIFVVLFVAANPMWEQGADTLLRALLQIDIAAERLLFWAAMIASAAAILSSVYITLPARKVKDATGLPAAMLRNALIVFNGLFALQLFSDIVVLGFSTGLPEGISYAEYAHRGSYPLVVTALLAGVFMLMSRRAAQEDQWMKYLLALWVFQNFILLGFAALRLGIYVQEFGWTYLRLHAFIWMGLVSFGLATVAFDLYRPQRNGWIVFANTRAAFGVLYLACFVNFGAIIAHANLDRAAEGLRVDWYYLCGLGTSSHAVLYERADGFDYPFRLSQLQHRPVDDWRDWDFRRARIDRRVALAQPQPLVAP